MAENQVVFRTFNQNFLKWQEQFKQVAASEGELPKEFNADLGLNFSCECSDENCRLRIFLSPKDYNKIHRDPNAFAIICGHEVDSIEDVIAKEPEYCVVRKHIMPPQNVKELNPTPANNV